jgi:protein involved in ribonucleotide reduction
MKQLLPMALLISMFVTACKKTEPEVQKTQPVELTSNITSMSLSGKAAGIDSFTIQSNSKWNLSISPNIADWLKTSVTNGSAGTTKVYLTVLQPNKTGTTRTATLQIVPEFDPSKPLTIEVMQQPYTIEPWSKLYGGSHSDIFNAVLPTADSGYLIVGGAESSDGDLLQNRGGYDGWIVKVSQDGSIAWQKSYGGSGTDWFNTIADNGKGGYLLAGYSYSSDGDITQSHRGNGDVWLMEIDAMGNKRWQKTYGGSGNESASSVVPTSDGGYIVQASSWSEDGDITKRVADMPNAYDWWIFKIDASGNKVWDKNFGGTQLDIANSMIAVNGGYLITGATRSSDYDAVGNHSGDGDGLLIKIDENGNKLWSKILGGTAEDGLNTAVATPDGGFVFTGYSSSTDGDVHENKGNMDVWIVKTDGSGNVLWEKTFGGPDADNANAVMPTASGGYLIAGYSRSSTGDLTANQGNYDIWVLALADQGNKVWQKSYGGAANDFPNYIQRGADGYYILAGLTDSNNGDCSGSHGSTEAWAVKFNLP